jgi:hypothetical protein
MRAILPNMRRSEALSLRDFSGSFGAVAEPQLGSNTKTTPATTAGGSNEILLGNN